MKRKGFLVFGFALGLGMMFGLSNVAPAAVKTTDAQILRRYTLDQMAAAAIVLRASLDGENLCSLDIETQAQLPMLLQALIDQKAASFNTKEWATDSAKLESCETRCRCAFYETVVNGNVPLELVTLIQTVKVKAARPLTKAAVVGCAKNNTWVCESALLKHLQSQTAKD